MNSTPRKIIQAFGLGTRLYAVCDDGTLWRSHYDEDPLGIYWQIVEGPPPLRKLEIERPRVDTNTPLQERREEPAPVRDIPMKIKRGRPFPKPKKEP